MPWDTSLNQNVKAGVERHVAMTHDLEEGDPRKFSISTPQRGSSAFTRVLESVPSSERIIHDVRNVFTSLEIVRKAKGIKVDGVGNANAGVRYLPVLIKKSGGGGFRVRAKDNNGDSSFVHQDAMQATKVKLEDSAKKNCSGGVKRATKQKEKQAKKAKND
jgi:hypothetical protein